jgi:hypothetical protein
MELHNLYNSSNIVRVIKSRRMRWAHHVAPMQEMKNVCKIQVQKAGWMRPLRIPGHRCVVNVRMELEEMD